MKKLTKTKKAPGVCEMCKKPYTRPIDWYLWVDVYINPGEVKVDQMCHKCIIRDFGKKAYERVKGES